MNLVGINRKPNSTQQLRFLVCKTSPEDWGSVVGILNGFAGLSGAKLTQI